MFSYFTYKKLRDNNWKNFSPTKRLKIFQKIEKIQSRKMKRPTFSVLPREWNDGSRGLCSFKEKTIFLNSKFFINENMQFLALATLFHEERHVQQNFIILSNEKLSRFSKAYKWKKNMEGYIEYNEKEKYSYYSMQEIERDANKFALIRLKKLRSIFRREENYFDAIKEKSVEFDFVKEKAKKELGAFYRLKLSFRNWKERRRNNKKK